MANSSCTINEKECCSVENLGVHDDFWNHAQRSFNSLAPNIFLCPLKATIIVRFLLYY